MLYTLLLIPLFFALMRLITRRYVYSALVTLSCAVISMIPGINAAGLLMCIGFLVSVLGDWLLAHPKKGHENRFIAGVAAFGIAHVLFIYYAATKYLFSRHALFTVIILAVLYAVYLVKRIFPHLDRPLRTALSGYAFASLLSLYFALCFDSPNGLAGVLYAAGIVFIVFSDTMIAEKDFANHDHRLSRWFE